MWQSTTYLKKYYRDLYSPSGSLRSFRRSQAMLIILTLSTSKQGRIFWFYHRSSHTSLLYSGLVCTCPWGTIISVLTLGLMFFLLFTILLIFSIWRRSWCQSRRSLLVFRYRGSAIPVCRCHTDGVASG
jgi:hypothetical protein